MVCAERRRLTARLVVHLGEVEARSLHLKAACSSMFDYCVRMLGMSKSSAHRRINAARLVRRFPSLLERLERREVRRLSARVPLARHLTETSFEEVMAAVAGKSQRETEAFVAKISPKPAVPDRVTAIASGAPMRIEPLSDAHYKVEFTASTALREKLERARDRMRHRNPSGDLAVVFERALDALLDKLAKERLGQTTRPRRNVRAAKPGTVTRAVRREVFERDGEQCTFAAEDGSRCPSRTLLELDHVESRALGGSSEGSILRVRCRAHNSLHDEEVFGKERIARAMDFRRRKSRVSGGEQARASADDPSPQPPPAEFDLAMRGLVNMGYSKSEVRRALDGVARRRDGTMAAVPDLLREAIALLT